MQIKLLCQISWQRELLPLFRKFCAWKVFRPSHSNHQKNSAFRSTLKCSESLHASLFWHCVSSLEESKMKQGVFYPLANLRRQVTATDFALVLQLS